MSDFLWVEKYRPKTIEECILPANTKKTFSSFLKKGEVPNLLLAALLGVVRLLLQKLCVMNLVQIFMLSMVLMKVVFLTL